MWKLVVAVCVAVMVAALAGIAVLGVRMGLLCRESVTTYAQEPRPAPRLTDGDVLHVGERRAAGGFSDPYQPAPRLIGNGSPIRPTPAEFPTRRRCGRPVGGYRYLVLEAIRPGPVLVAVVGLDGVRRTLRATVVAS
jgi:hypothetical protein